MKTILFALIACAVILQATARQYQVQLLDKEDHKPVAFADIGIQNSNVGVNSDENGRFSVVLGPEVQEDTLQISLIGYQDYNISVKDFEKEIGSSEGQIFLQKSAVPLGEIIVRPAKLTPAKLGNDINCRIGGKNTALPIPGAGVITVKGKKVIDTLTELGALMKIKHKKTFIDSVQINIASCTYEHIFYRLNVYEKTGGNFKNILAAPVYIDLDKSKVGGMIRVDLTGKNLVVSNDIVVSLEKVKELGEGQMAICARVFDGPGYGRIASHHDNFARLPIISFGIVAFVTFSGQD